MGAYITIHGNIGRAPEFKTLPSGTEVAEFTVAVNHWKGRDKEATTSWFRVSVYGKAAETTRDWQKGDMAIVNGELELREYTAQDGAKRTSADLNARNLTNVSKMMRARGSGGGAGMASESGPGWTESRPSGGSAPARREAASPRDTEDDLPF